MKNNLISLLASELGLTRSDILQIAANAPRRYKVFYIQKRTGGLREIAQPARELKAIQRVLIKCLLSELPIHPAAMAYREGKSIRNNAEAHVGTTPILKMDFKDFFPSIRAIDWHNYCVSNKMLNGDDCKLSTQLFFRRGKKEKSLKLSIGAPSSPMLSNILMFKFDTYISDEANKRGITYTRYADDLTFSGQRIGMLKDMERLVYKACSSIKSPRLTVNEDKTTYVTTARKRLVTGIVLSNSGELSLGRDKKRLISSMVHRVSLNQSGKEELMHLCGQLAYVNVVEPSFLQRLEAKYGTAVIKFIQSQRSINM